MCAAGIGVENRAQDQCGGARLASARWPRIAKCLPQQIVDPDHSRDRSVLPDAADPDRSFAVTAKAGSAAALVGNPHPTPERWTDRHAAIERSLPPTWRATIRRRRPSSAIEIRPRPPSAPAPDRQRRHDCEHDGVRLLDGQQRTHFGRPFRASTRDRRASSRTIALAAGDRHNLGRSSNRVPRIRLSGSTASCMSELPACLRLSRRPAHAAG